MAIFSVWDTYSGTAAPGGWGTVFGGEGTGYSVRIAYPWVKGTTYTLTFNLQSDNGTQKVWQAQLTNKTTGATTLIGSINVPSSHGNISATVSTFHERFYGSTDSCDILEPSRARIDNLKLGGAAGKLYSTTIGTAGLCSNSGVNTADNKFISWFNAAPAPAVAPTTTPTVTPKPTASTPTSTPTASPSPTTPALTNPEAPKTSVPQSYGQTPKKTVAPKHKNFLMWPIFGAGTLLLGATIFALKSKIPRTIKPYSVPAHYTQFDAPHTLEPGAGDDPTGMQHL